MSVDTNPIGITAARLMEALPEESDGDIVAVGIVVVVDEGEQCFTQIQTSVDLRFERMGLFADALEIAKQYH